MRSESFFFLMALLAETAAAACLLWQGTGFPSFYAALLLHFSAFCLALPKMAVLHAAHPRWQGPWRLSGLILFVFLVPLVGMMLILILILMVAFPEFSFFRTAPQRSHFLFTSPAPDYQAFRREDDMPTRAGGLREHVLTRTDAPVGAGMKVLLGLQRMQPRFSSVLLRHALGDERDDIRLLAYGILDAKEKKISRMMEKAMQRYREYDAETQPSRHYMAAKELCELHWELVYQQLVQGEVRRHAIGQAQRYAEEALKGRIYDGELRFFLGRSRLMTGDLGGAASAFEAAVALDFPPARVLPYMAEFAYLKRDYAMVRETLRQSCLPHPLPVLRQTAEFWS